jgi:hypothetical protein
VLDTDVSLKPNAMALASGSAGRKMGNWVVGEDNVEHCLGFMGHEYFNKGNITECLIKLFLDKDSRTP